MYGRRVGSPFMHPSISAPALGREPPSFPERIWYRKPSSDPRSGEHSGASSPTTSLLLYMWGYDETHAPNRNREPGGYPDLLTTTSGSLYRRRVASDASFFRRVTALVFGLAVVACFAALLLTAGSRFRPDTAVGASVENSTDPVLTLGERHLPFLPRQPVQDVKGAAAGSPPPTSASVSDVLSPGRNVALSPGQNNAHGHPVSASTTGRHVSLQARESTDQRHPVRLYR
ncbi:hypothetical protein V5799_021484 [Amblyomma americanum]|uniref:Transmembrane protein n=1 Tax=Amblyomma americanum TaxID=6943 RepID=A0AAQ4FPS6_AMBAM